MSHAGYSRGRRVQSIRGHGISPRLHLQSNITNVAHDVVGRPCARYDGQEIDGGIRVAGTQDQVLVGDFHVANDAPLLPAHGIERRLAPAMREERVMVAVDDDGGARQQTRMHARCSSAFVR